MNTTEQMNRKELTEARTSTAKFLRIRTSPICINSRISPVQLWQKHQKEHIFLQASVSPKMDTSGIKSEMRQENKDISHSSIQYPIWEAAMEVTWEQ